MERLKKVVINVIDWILYSIISEKQKKRLTSLLSKEQKAKIKQFTQFGKKYSQIMKIEKIQDNLYSLGLADQALEDLLNIYKNEKSSFMRRLAAWELTLWYANQYSEKDSRKALGYLSVAKREEKRSDQLRRIAIIEAECLANIGEILEARKVLNEALSLNIHPDLYLAVANLEVEIEKKLGWINKVYDYYELHPITLSDLSEPIYDNLKMKKIGDKKNNNGKVSVIIPAYNSEKSIHIAIDSILSQTWENIEVIIVDDCSIDNTLEVIKQYAKQDNRIKVFSTPINSGPYVARNIGLQNATGEFVTINDADDWSHEKKIEIQVKHLLENPSVIANTSEHARLTENLQFYRRGTPGRYIFSNMSSIMFRRKQVMEKLGYWDSVRFAADGEFKRRLIKTFGEKSYVDLKTGPLSLPKQSLSSLTGDSAYGYDGFFKGARKEYVESLEYYHINNAGLYYPFPQLERPFPVPEPMLPYGEEKEEGRRNFDFVISTDFRKVLDDNSSILKIIRKILESKENIRIGLVQMYHYDLNLPLILPSVVREIVNGENVQILVYGEKINTEKLLILDYNVISVKQKYTPTIYPKQVKLIIDDVNEKNDDLNRVLSDLINIYGENVTVENINQLIN